MTYIPDWSEDETTRLYLGKLEFNCKCCGVGIDHIGYCEDCSYEIGREEDCNVLT